jgi:hypothetical protein
VKAVGIAIVAMAVSACGGAASSSIAAHTPLVAMRVAVGTDERFTCFVDAAKAGAYRAYGLDVQLVSASGDPVASLEASAADVAAVDVSSAVLSAPTWPDLRLVAVDLTSPDFVKLWARSGAQAPPTHGRLGTAFGGAEEAAAAHLSALEPKLQLVRLDDDTITHALGSDAVDYAFASGQTAALEAVGARLIGPSADFGFTYQQGLVARSGWLADHLAATRHLTEALALGCRGIGPIQANAQSASLAFAMKAPSATDIDDYTIELARHTGSPSEATTVIAAFVRQDIVSNTNTLNPGCDCQWLPSPSPSPT